MNAAYVHICLSHAPAVITLMGFALLAFGVWRKSEDIKRSALGILVFAGLTVIPLYLTGGPAADAVKGLPGFADRILDQHQAIAAATLAGSLLIAMTAAAGLSFFRRERSIAGWLSTLVLAGALVMGGLLAWTAHLGGQIRHSEIRASGAEGN